MIKIIAAVFAAAAIALMATNAQQMDIGTTGKVTQTIGKGLAIDGPATKTVLFSGGQFKQWLIVTRHNEAQTDKAFEPSYTAITSQFQPIVKKLAGGKFEITFTSEKDLP